MWLVESSGGLRGGGLRGDAWSFSPWYNLSTLTNERLDKQRNWSYPLFLGGGGLYRVKLVLFIKKFPAKIIISLFIIYPWCQSWF